MPRDARAVGAAGAYPLPTPDEPVVQQVHSRAVGLLFLSCCFILELPRVVIIRWSTISRVPFAC